jgi:DNA-binding ferritin-like protein (Dps family)
MTASTAMYQVLGAIAYGEWKAYEGARERADAASDEAEVAKWKKVAAEELRHHKGFVRRLEALGADPERAMAPYRTALDTYHGLEGSAELEDAVWGYLGEGIADDLLVWLRKVVDPDTAAFIDTVIADEEEHEALATEHLRALLDAHPDGRRQAARAATRMVTRMFGSGRSSGFLPFGAFLRLGRGHELLFGLVAGAIRRLQTLGVSPITSRSPPADSLLRVVDRMGGRTRHTRWRAGVAAAVLALVAGAPAVADPLPVPSVVTVDAATTLGPSNQHLTGLGWNNAAPDPLADIQPVAPLEPHQIRIDAGLERLSTGPGALDAARLQALLDRIAAVRAIGAEPQVILSYMPPWLARHGGAFDPRDATKVAPTSMDAWQALVEDVVTRLATAEAPALRFEVWNEPDIPIFWQDLPTDFFELAVRTHRAVAAVAAREGLALEVGGPAVAFPDPAWMLPYLARVRAEGLALDFVSWHYYGNYPFLGPDGAENIFPAPLMPVYPVLGRRNPLASPRAYRLGTEAVRSWVAGALAGSGLDPDLVIDEWNLSAGGYDLRNDTSEGAAFVAGTLMEMEAAGLDAADFYRAFDDPAPARRGDWGLVDGTGARKPSWWVFDAWRATSGSRLATLAPEPDLFARATRDGADVHVLVSAFAAEGGRDRTVAVDLDGATCAGPIDLRVLTGPDGSFDAVDTLPPADPVTFDLPAQSVAWVTAHDCS